MSKNNRANKISFIILIALTLLMFEGYNNTQETQAVPPNWVNCNLNQNNLLEDINVGPSSGLITPFWEALVGMSLNEMKSFVIPKSENPYGPDRPSVYNKDLYYDVRIDRISGSSSVQVGTVVDVYYWLYLDCNVVEESTTTSTNSLPTTTSSPPPDNSMLIIGGLGIIVIGGGVLGYFTVIKPRLELPQDTSKLEQKQAKKQINQAKELLDIIQDKKEVNSKQQTNQKPLKPKFSKKPRRR